ncbi:MAG: hypothetical protein AB7S63_08955, partial [Thauera sp.]
MARRRTIIRRVSGPSVRFFGGSVEFMIEKRFKAVLAGLAACLAMMSSSAGAAPRQIEIFHRLPEAKVAALSELVEQFNAQAKDYRVVLSSGDWRTSAADM